MHDVVGDGFAGDKAEGVERASRIDGDKIARQALLGGPFGLAQAA